MNRSRILLHSCCAPCAAGPYSLISLHDHTDLFFYNPNISPDEEYVRRRDELVVYADKIGAKLIAADGDADEWLRSVKPYAHLGEGSRRCEICFRFRMRKTFEYAKDGGYRAAGTVLTVSPHKNSPLILSIGAECARTTGIEFINRDFKKDSGYLRSTEIARGEGFYRQNYCGCIFSLEERAARRTKPIISP